jgi:hypothetical protein
MCKKPIGYYKYEKIKEIVDKIIIETDKDLEKYNTIIDEIKENKICTQQLISIVSRLIQKIFSSDVGWHFCWKESVENTLKASIDSMLFCMGEKVNWLHNDQIKELILNNIRFQLYHEKNPNFILKCFIFRDLMTEREYDNIHCRD